MDMIKQAQTEKTTDVSSRLKADWCYQSAVLVEAEKGDQESQLRVLTLWSNGQGEVLELFLNFIAKPFYNTLVIMSSSQCKPEIKQCVGLLDEFGFSLKGYRRRQLIWDLVMRLDLEKVSRDLQSQLATH